MGEPVSVSVNINRIGNSRAAPQFLMPSFSLACLSVSPTKSFGLMMAGDLGTGNGFPILQKTLRSVVVEKPQPIGQKITLNHV